MSYKPRDLFPSTLEVAQLFLRAYDQVEEGKQGAKEALCEKYGVPEKEAFRWIHVVRPHFRDQNDPWPFYEDIEARALDPSEHSDESKVDSPGEDEAEDDDDHVVVETRAKLAELIGADTTTVWRGVDQNRPAKGYPVHEWVRLDEKGHIDHFEVPITTDLVDTGSGSNGGGPDPDDASTWPMNPSGFPDGFFYEGEEYGGPEDLKEDHFHLACQQLHPGVLQVVKGADDPIRGALKAVKEHKRDPHFDPQPGAVTPKECLLTVHQRLEEAGLLSDEVLPDSSLAGIPDPAANEHKKSFYEGDLVQIAPDSLYDPFPSPGEVVDVDRTNGQIRVQFPQGKTDWMGKSHFQKLDNQDRGVSHAHSDEARPEDPAEDPAGGSDKETGTPGGWSWDKDYVYNAAQDTYLFHLSQYEGAPFVVEGDKLRRMVRRYSKHAGDRAWNLDEVAAAEGMPRDAWQEIKQNLGITHTSPPHLPEDFQREDDIEGMAADDVQKKKHEWKKHNEQKTYRELKTAADKWFKLEGVMEKASEELMSFLQDYEPPQVSVSSGGVGADSAALYNNQDWHIGARPHEGADQFSVQAYCDGLVEKSKQAIGDALNLRSLETFYMVVGGDLVHSDNFDGSTTKGTDLDMACGHAEAVKRAVETSIRVADLARSAADEVVILPVPGNHDRALSTAAALAVSHHYNQTDDVRCLPINERQYVTYYNHLMCVTHGDIKKKALRNIGDTIRAEARNKMGRTSFTTLATGHFHYRSRDVEDKSGRVHYQAPSPAPTDRWHNKEVFVGSRKGVQLVLLDQNDGGDHVIHA